MTDTPGAWAFLFCLLLLYAQPFLPHGVMGLGFLQCVTAAFLRSLGLLKNLLCVCLPGSWEALLPQLSSLVSGDLQGE